MSSDDEDLDDLEQDLAELGETDGARLRVSRPATADDLAAFMPDTTADERAAFLERLAAQECEATFSVVSTVSGSELAGVLLGPPGSARAPISRRTIADQALDAMVHHPEHADATFKISAFQLAEDRLIELFGTIDPEAIAAAGGDHVYVGAARNILARKASAG